jgi:ectoine hydroxylase-related dioxygenase (phytanoyl-CoA dioxygenase family)
MTAEHVDLTETPNSALTLTAYVAVSDQRIANCSKLMVYPGSHLMIDRVPRDNFDYVRSGGSQSFRREALFGEINGIVEEFPELDWVRECLYHLLVLNISEYAILKSTFTLMLFNPAIFGIDPVPVPLKQGDVLFFLSNLLHGSSSHDDPSASRVSLAVRGGYPYYEPSGLISDCVEERFYDTRMKGASTPRGQFLFSGTPQMIERIEDRKLFDNIIYRIGNR